MKTPKKHQGPAALARVGVTADGTVPPALSVSSGFQFITLTTKLLPGSGEDEKGRSHVFVKNLAGHWV